MNRRGMFKKVAALGLVIPFAPAAWKAVQAQQRYNQCSTQPCAGNYVPPAPDTRSPEQVVTDSRVELIRYHVRDLVSDWPGRQRLHYHTNASTFAGVAHQLGLDGTPFEMREIFGVLSIICNGNVMSIA